METDRLQYFCTIAEAGSLTAAAGILNVSHSGLSKAMAVLQAELGLALFRPLGRGLELTPAGRETYAKSKAVLESLARLRSAAPAAEKVRIGLSEIFGLRLAGELSRQIPGLDLDEVDAGEAESAILEGRLDFALTFVPFPQAELEYLKIKKAVMAVFHNNPAFKKMELSKLPFVVPNSEILSNPLSIRHRDGWPSGLERNCVFGASSLSLALEMARAGSAAVFMPRFLAGPGLLEFETKKNVFAPCERDIFLVKKKNIEESAEMKKTARLVRALC